jgi:long-subunit acyl-CoA synthetase (AMP-forming)
MIRFIAAALATAIAVPAYAQSTTTEYYVVQDSTTKKCTIVDKKPTTTTMVQVGPLAFKSRNEAESGMKTIKVCESK